MQFLKSIFRGLGACIKFINTYFKTFVFLFIIFLIFAPSSEEKTPRYNLAKLVLNSEISNVEPLLEKMKAVREDANIKGVLFVIDSPGGAFAPSMSLALALEKLRAKKPVLVYASGTLASGSYLAAAGANKIYANPASFIGSIGVIVQGADISELASKIGFKPQVIKAGEFKEAGTFLRAWDAKEKQALQSLVNESYALFTDYVAKARGMDLAQKDKWANARVFLAKEAKQLRLIDELADIEDATRELEKLSQIEAGKGVFKEESKLDKFIDKLSEQTRFILTESLKSVFGFSVR